MDVITKNFRQFRFVKDRGLLNSNNRQNGIHIFVPLQKKSINLGPWDRLGGCTSFSRARSDLAGRVESGRVG